MTNNTIVDHRDISAFEVASMYSNEEIRRSLQVGNAGGVRISMLDRETARRAVVMTSLPSARQDRENPYHDRIENEVLVYTAAGLEGDQSLGGVNRRLIEQKDTLLPIYAFMLVSSRRDRSTGPRRWQYLGLLEYLRHYPEKQLDSRGQLRDVWVFEFGIHGKPQVVPVDADTVVNSELLRHSTFSAESAEEREIAPSASNIGLEEGSHTPEIIEGKRGQLLGMHPRDFEHLISELLIHSGFQEVVITRYSQDGGIDVNAIAGPSLWPLRGTLLQVQAKRWHHTVGRKDVAELRGSLSLHARGAIVTTSHYSKAAITEAKSDGKLPLVLVDGFSLAKVVLNLGIKVS